MSQMIRAVSSARHSIISSTGRVSSLPEGPATRRRASSQRGLGRRSCEATAVARTTPEAKRKCRRRIISGNLDSPGPVYRGARLVLHTADQTQPRTLGSFGLPSPFTSPRHLTARVATPANQSGYPQDTLTSSRATHGPILTKTDWAQVGGDRGLLTCGQT